MILSGDSIVVFGGEVLVGRLGNWGDEDEAGNMCMYVPRVATVPVGTLALVVVSGLFTEL